jgi:hypothetical protein
MIQNKMQVQTVNFRLYFKDDFDFEIKSKICSLNLRLVLDHILNSQDVLSFRNLFFILDRLVTISRKRLFRWPQSDKT